MHLQQPCSPLFHTSLESAFIFVILVADGSLTSTSSFIACLRLLLLPAVV
jgi:hypothetical protein